MQFFTALLMLVAGFLLIFDNISIVAGHLIFCQQVELNSMGILPYVGLPLVILLAWGCAMIEKGMMTFNFSGSRLYGKTPTENGYIATKWIAAFGFPILPVVSYEVLGETKTYPQSQYALRPLEDFAWPQIIRTATIGYGILLAAEIVLVAILNIAICGGG